MFVSYSAAATATASTVIPYTIPFLIPATPGAHYTDDFNRANSASLGASWNTDAFFGTSLGIVSNAAVAVGGNIYALPMNTGDNQVTVIMKGTPAAADFVQVLTRCASATDTTSPGAAVYLYMNQAAPWILYRSATDGTGVSTAGNESWADGDSIVFTAVGATLTVKRNGSTVLTTGGATDLAAGYVVIGVNAASSVGFDSFDAQDI
jgi:hypothetical protein